MSQNDIHSFRLRAEALLREAMNAADERERRRLIDLAARWHSFALMATRQAA